jgi:hypothetical protein
MEEERLLSLLEETAQRLGIAVRYERFDGADVTVRDGLCLVKGERVLFVEKRRSLHEKILVLAKTISDLDSENTYMPPVVRELIDSMRVPNDD